MNTTCESRTLCLICVLYSTIWSRDHSEELTDARYEAFLDENSITCVSTLSLNSASVSPILQAAPADRPISAQVEVRRSSSTGMMGVRRKNVMKKVAS